MDWFRPERNQKVSDKYKQARIWLRSSAVNDPSSPTL